MNDEYRALITTWFEASQANLLAKAKRHGLTHEAAEELVQNCLATLLKKETRFNDLNHFKNCMSIIIKHGYCDHLKYETAHKRGGVDDEKGGSTTRITNRDMEEIPWTKLESQGFNDAIQRILRSSIRAKENKRRKGAATIPTPKSAKVNPGILHASIQNQWQHFKAGKDCRDALAKLFLDLHTPDFEAVLKGNIHPHAPALMDLFWDQLTDLPDQLELKETQNLLLGVGKAYVEHFRRDHRGHTNEEDVRLLSIRLQNYMNQLQGDPLAWFRIYLRFWFERLTQEEIAACEALTIERVRDHLRKAKNHLRDFGMK